MTEFRTPNEFRLVYSHLSGKGIEGGPYVVEVAGGQELTLYDVSDPAKSEVSAASGLYRDEWLHNKIMKGGIHNMGDLTDKTD